MAESSTAASGSGIKVDAQVKKAWDETCRILKREGAAEIAERAWSQMTAPPSPTSVVIIGEVKRGKSSLVNSLLGGRNASQVDVEIATSAFLRFRRPADGVPEGTTTLMYAGGRTRRIDFADLPDWVTVSGRHVVDASVEELPIGADVALGSPFVPNVVIVDTPGVGGLNPHHLQLATDIATQASVLVMTCDSAAPITSHELTFLQSVGTDIESVIIVVTKTDKNLQHWRTIADENRRLLRQYAPRFGEIPIIGVSNRRALAALRLPPGAERDTRLARSGLTELAEELARVSRSADTLLTLNCLRMLRNGLERVSGQLDLEEATFNSSTRNVVLTELNAERERLKALMEEERGGWRDFLMRDIAKIQSDTTRFLDHRLDELRSRWRRKIDEAKFDVLRKAPQLFVAEMTADLEVLVKAISEFYVTSINQLLANLAADVQIPIDGLSGLRQRAETPRGRGEGVGDPMMLQMGVIGGSMIGGNLMAAVGLAGGMLFWPAVAAIGAAWVAVNFGFRAVKQGRANLQQWLDRTIVAVNKDVAREINDRTNAVKPEIVLEYRRYLTESIAELKKVITKADNLAKASQAEQDDERRVLVSRVKDVKAATAAIDTQLARFAPGKGQAAVPMQRSAPASAAAK
ncbi:MAG: dynamin family protein [Mycobacterium sp.]